MLKDIQEAIESLEARIEAEEEQIRLMKNDLRALKERLPQGTEITGAKSLPESLDELFRQLSLSKQKEPPITGGFCVNRDGSF